MPRGVRNHKNMILRKFHERAEMRRQGHKPIISKLKSKAYFHVFLHFLV